MARLIPSRLSAYAGLLFVAIGLAQLVASVLFYRSIDQVTLQEDHARRVAELLVVSRRVDQIEPDRISQMMTSRHLEVSVTAEPVVTQNLGSGDLAELEERILDWEPTLREKDLRLRFEPRRGAGEDLVGSMQLDEKRWLNFRSPDISSMWPVALRAVWMSLVTSLVCIGVGLAVMQLLTRPLRRLSEAAREIGHGRRMHISENGPADIRELSQAMNDMQDRIAQLLENQAKSFEAISHDLRTPLARQKLATELVDDTELRELLGDNVNEMEGMLQSLQQFLRAQHLSAEPEEVDLAQLVRSVAAAHADKITVFSQPDICVRTYREPLAIALQAIIDNSARFGTKVEIFVFGSNKDWRIDIKDDGPGIPKEHFNDVLAPFFRLDEARGRTTSGFGLGIPMAHQVLHRFGGSLSLSDTGRGLRVTLHVPNAS